MKIKIRYEKLTNGYTAKADAGLGCYAAQGKDKASARKGVVAYLLTGLAREIEEGDTTVDQVFPLLVMDVP